MASKDLKELNMVSRLNVPMDIVALVKNLKETPEWRALKEVMKLETSYRKDLAFHLNEQDPKFPLKHIALSSPSSAYNFLIRFVEKEVFRESQE